MIFVETGVPLLSNCQASNSSDGESFSLRRKGSLSDKKSLSFDGTKLATGCAHGKVYIWKSLLDKKIDEYEIRCYI